MQPNISKDTEIYLSKYVSEHSDDIYEKILGKKVHKKGVPWSNFRQLSHSHMYKLTHEETEYLHLNTLCSDVKRLSPELNKKAIKELEAQRKE